MSRAATKSRADKTKTQAPSASTPVTNTDVITGKITDTDWMFLLHIDDVEDFLSAIMSDVETAVEEKITQLEIERELFPYTVEKLRGYLTELVELEEPQIDAGECVDDWVTDAEPPTAVADCWAQGSVNVSRKRPSYAQEQMSRLPDDMTLVIEDGRVGSVLSPDEHSANKRDALPPTPPLEVHEMITLEPERPMTGREDKYKNPPKLKLIRMQRTVKSPSATSEAVRAPTKGITVLKKEAGRPPGFKDVTYDAEGNVVSMVRFNPEKFPTHSVETKFLLVDPRIEAEAAKLDALRTGKVLATLRHGNKVKLEPISSFQVQIPNQKPAHYQGSVIESIDVQPGVIVREGKQEKRGPPLKLTS